MKNKILQLLVVMLLVAPLCLFAKSVQAIEFPEISAEELKSRMDSGEKLLLINPMSDIEYHAKHIPGSVNIPLENILITEKLPKNKQQLIVTYCLGRKCIYSNHAARLIAQKGYTNIMVFRDGIPGWINAGYVTTQSDNKENTKVKVLEPDQLNTALEDYLIVDIRPANAYDMGYLPKSRAMPMAYLSMLSTELPKDSKIAIVDHSGKQCKKAAQWLIHNGFADVSILKGGMTGYAKEGFELEK